MASEKKTPFVLAAESEAARQYGQERNISEFVLGALAFRREYNSWKDGFKWAETVDANGEPLEVQPNDQLLIELYRRFSDELYAAGFMSLGEGTLKQFERWLRSEVVNPTTERQLADYELEALPRLRKVWENVNG